MMGSPAGENMPQMQARGERRKRLIRAEFEAFYRRGFPVYRDTFNTGLGGSYLNHGVQNVWQGFQIGWASCEIAVNLK